MRKQITHEKGQEGEAGSNVGGIKDEGERKLTKTERWLDCCKGNVPLFSLLQHTSYIHITLVIIY